MARQVGSMKIRFENLKGVLTQISGPDLDEIKKYANENNLTYVDSIITNVGEKTIYRLDFKKPGEE